MTTDDSELVLGGSSGVRGGVPGRIQAAAFDLLVGTYVVSNVLTAAATLGLVGDRLPIGAGLAALWALLVLVEGLSGRSPGKHVAGLGVVDSAGRRIGLRAAVVRRPWGWPLVLVPLGGLPRAIGTIAALVVLVLVGIATVRARDGRGPHDSLAGTSVVVGPAAGRARLVVLGALLLVLLLTAIVRATGSSTPLA